MGYFVNVKIHAACTIKLRHLQLNESITQNIIKKLNKYKIACNANNLFDTNLSTLSQKRQRNILEMIRGLVYVSGDNDIDDDDDNLKKSPCLFLRVANYCNDELEGDNRHSIPQLLGDVLVYIFHSKIFAEFEQWGIGPLDNGSDRFNIESIHGVMCPLTKQEFQSIPSLF